MKVCTTSSLLFFTILGLTEAADDIMMRREVLDAKNAKSATKANSKVGLGTQANRTGKQTYLINGDYVKLKNIALGDSDGWLGICNDCDGVALDYEHLPPPAISESGSTFLGDACVYTANRCVATPFRIIKVGYDPEEANRDTIHHRDLVMLKRDHDSQDSDSRYAYLGSGGEGHNSHCDKASGMARMFQGTVQNEIAFEGNHLPDEFMWTIANTAGTEGPLTIGDVEGIFLTKALPAIDSGGYLAICEESSAHGSHTSCGSKRNVITRQKFSKTDTAADFTRMKWLMEFSSQSPTRLCDACFDTDGVTEDNVARGACEAPHHDKSDWTASNQGHSQGGGTQAPTPAPTHAPTTAVTTADICAAGFTTDGVNGPYNKVPSAQTAQYSVAKDPYENSAQNFLIYWDDTAAEWKIVPHDEMAAVLGGSSGTEVAHTSCDVSMTGCGHSTWDENGAPNNDAKTTMDAVIADCSTATSSSGGGGGAVFR